MPKSTHNAPSAYQLFGDGAPIPDDVFEHLAGITDEICVLHKWQPGDVFVYDNIIAQHGRQPWEGEQSDRVVLASLFDGNSIIRMQMLTPRHGQAFFQRIEKRKNSIQKT